MSTPSNSIAQRIVRPVVQATVAFIILVTGMLAIASPAQAQEYVTRCGGIFWGAVPNGCVGVYTGSKNKSTGKQWVGQVIGYQRDGNRQFIEIWGDGFYYSGHGEELTRNINRWVRSGTGICARATDRYGQSGVGCISIKV